MEDLPINREQTERSPDETAALIADLLDAFRYVDRAVAAAHLATKRNIGQHEEGLEEKYDHLLDALAALPATDVELARYAYETLTDSNDPRDRYWAASLFSRMLPVDKQMGLSMLERLIGSRETEQAVQDRAWDELTTTVASENLLTLGEAIEFVDIYHMQLRDRWLKRINQARTRQA